MRLSGRGFEIPPPDKPATFRDMDSPAACLWPITVCFWITLRWETKGKDPKIRGAQIRQPKPVGSQALATLDQGESPDFPPITKEAEKTQWATKRMVQSSARVGTTLTLHASKHCRPFAPSPPPNVALLSELAKLLLNCTETIQHGKVTKVHNRTHEVQEPARPLGPKRTEPHPQPKGSLRWGGRRAA